MRIAPVIAAAALSSALAVGVFTHAQVAAQPKPDAPVQTNGKALSTVQDLSRAFRNVGKEIEPSVVNIKVRKVIEAPKGQGRRFHGNSPFNDPFFRRFFDHDGDGEPDTPFPFDMPGGGEQIGQGSGVIMEVQGSTAYIVTNNHVAGDADEMEISLNDGRTITNGKLVGADPRTDLAVVKIEADNLKSAQWGNSDELEKGDWVLAFGSPFGYVGSMTHGIISATSRNNLGIIPQGYENFIQIDAPINPGNSGGPLTNIHGEVIGINTAIASRTGGFQGIGFAIPSNQAKQIYQVLHDKGKVVRGWLGVSISSVSDPQTRDVVRDMGYTGSKGAFVQEVLKETPATGKLEAGDIVTKINGKEIADSAELRNTIAMLTPGSEAKLDIIRGGKPMTVGIKLGDQPANLAAGGTGAHEETPEQAESPKLGVRLGNLTPELIRQLGLKADQLGAVIETVEPRSPAAKAGLQPGDVIVKVGGLDVKNASEATSTIRKQDLKKGVTLYVTTRDGSRFVHLQVTPGGTTEKSKGK